MDFISFRLSLASCISPPLNCPLSPDLRLTHRHESDFNVRTRKQENTEISSYSLKMLH